MNGNVTPKVKEILKIAASEARLYNYRKLEPEHLLVAILVDNHNEGIDLMNDSKIDIDNVFAEVSDFLIKNNVAPMVGKAIKTIPPTPITKDILNDAIGICAKSKEVSVGVGHVLLSILSSDTKAQEILNDNKLFYSKLWTRYKNKLNTNDMDEYNDTDPLSGAGGSTKPTKKSASKTPVLDNFCRDITKVAKEGDIDPVIGRDNEIKRVSQILSRRKKNNPVLIGEAGVGKSSIIEGLAKMIVEGDCPTSLMDKKVFALDVASVIAGTKYRGQFESRMKAILEELIENKDIILFIDEMHTIVGAGSSSGSLDISNIFKPALARGELQVIGATTLDEFRENIEKDGALTRRFQQVLVKEPSLSETKHILNNVKDKYEDYHKVFYSEEAIDECVKMADRYITDRAMPDKALDILDECGATTNIDLVKPEEIKELEARKKQIGEEKLEVIKKQQYEDAAKLRNEEDKIDASIELCRQKWLTEMNTKRTIITPELVAQVVSLMTGIPLNKLSSEENKKLAKIEEFLRGKVIGQDEAVSKVSKVIRRNKLGLGNKNKPQGSFIFLGSSGVGKTYLAKVIAEYIFNDSDSLIRVDMSEYMEKFAVSRLIGAPPGYVGYSEGGKLTEAVRRRPHSVVLFDEVEKAHPDVFNLMLQLLDEGFLTDSLGRRVNFRNTLVILTSNVGVKELSQFGTSMGFETVTSAVDEQKRVETILNKAVKGKFNPEFLNRIDDIVVFNQLKENDIIKMADLEMSHVKNRINELGYEIKISRSALTFVAKQAYSKEYGARPLGRALQRLIEDNIAEEILSNRVKPGDTIKIGYSKKENKLTFKS